MASRDPFVIQVWQLFLLGQLRRSDGTVVTSIIEAHRIAKRQPN